jgi:hypothetical protein
MQRLVRAATRVSYVVVLLDTSIVNVALDRLQAALGGGHRAILRQRLNNLTMPRRYALSNQIPPSSQPNRRTQ